MTTYNSYAEAKIVNPESEIFTNETNDKFQSKSDESFFIRCLPSHHCITVEKFLADGYEFVEGDVCLNISGDVVAVKNVTNWNEPLPADDERYVLRAAALEVMAQDNEAAEVKAVVEHGEAQPTRDEIGDLLLSIRWAAGSAVHHGCCLEFAEKYDLINGMNDLIKHQCEQSEKVYKLALLEQPKPKRVKVEYVKVEDSIFDLQHDLVEGKLFYQDIEENYYPIETEIQLVSCFDSICVYRKVETVIDERQEFVEIACNEVNATLDSVAAEDFGRLFDSGKFKLVEGA